MLLRFSFQVCLSLMGAAAIAFPVSRSFVNMLEHSGIQYSNVSGGREKQYILSTIGNGAALFDYDEDGDLDLYLVNGSLLDGKTIRPAGPNLLYRNEGDWVFRDVTAAAGVGDRGWGIGSAVGDYDNDGHPDLYVTNIGPNVLYRNQGDGTFVDVTEEAGVGHQSFGASCAFFDSDADGDLDLYVTNYVEPNLDQIPLPGARHDCRWLGLPVMCGPRGLEGASDVYFRNNGNGTFTEATREAGLYDQTAAYGLGVVVGDYDGDGAPDLYVANDSVPNFLFRNNGKGFFTEQGLLSGASHSSEGHAQAGMGVDMGDFNGDGLLDLFVTNFSHDTNTAYRNIGSGLFFDATSEVSQHVESWFYLGWATRLADLDNDGDEDLFVTNGHVYPEVDSANLDTSFHQRNQIFWNQGGGQMIEAEFPVGDAMREIASSRGGAFGDIDNDGDIDAVIVNIDARPSLLQNQLPKRGSWVTFRLVGTSSSRDAVGARLTLLAGSLKQVKEVRPSGSYLSSNDVRVHFGLGDQSSVDEVVISWPSGREQRLSGVEPGQILTVVEGQTTQGSLWRGQRPGGASRR